MLAPTPPHRRLRLLPLPLRCGAASATATPERGVMTGTLTAPLGASTTIAIALRLPRLRRVKETIINGGGQASVLHRPIGTEEEARILLRIGDRRRCRPIREGEMMGMTGGEGVLEEDTAAGTEGDLLIRFRSL